jgi:hypothetical protein
VVRELALVRVVPLLFPPEEVSEPPIVDARSMMGPRRVGRVPGRGGSPGKALGEPSAVNRRSTRPTTEDAEGPGEWPRLPSACGATGPGGRRSGPRRRRGGPARATETLACAAFWSPPRFRDGWGRDRAPGPGFNILASDRRPPGAEPTHSGLALGRVGHDPCLVEPSHLGAYDRTHCELGGRDAGLALQRRARDRRSTLGSRAP